MTQRTNHSKNIYISREEVNGRIPLDDSVSTTCVTNHIVEMTVMEKPIRRKCAIKRLDKDHYVNLRTGEVCEFRHSVKNQRKNMNKAYTTLRRLINYNFTGNESELHVTLTYGEDMQSRENVSAEFKAFWKRLKYAYPTCEYIVIYEPTEKGVWHVHVLIKDRRGKRLFIPKGRLSYMWRKGYVCVNRILDNDNIAAYFMGLFSDRNKEKSGSKKVERIPYYANNYRLYSRSKGIKTPPLYKETYKQALERVKGLEPCFENAYGIYDSGDGTELNVIYHKQYNKRRK